MGGQVSRKNCDKNSATFYALKEVFTAMKTDYFLKKFLKLSSKPFLKNTYKLIGKFMT